MRQLSRSLVLASSLALAQQQERPSDPPLVVAPTRTDSAPTAHATILADGGKVFDLYGSYDVVWGLCVLTGFIAAALHWPLRDAPQARLTAPAGA
jgi:hypothetical protein